MISPVFPDKLPLGNHVTEEGLFLSTEVFQLPHEDKMIEWTISAAFNELTSLSISYQLRPT